MTKVMLGTNEKIEYSQWIKDIRETLGIKKEEFGDYVVHYVKKIKKNRIEDYMSFHRNSVKNWENDKKPPVDVCSFLSLAVLEYDCIENKKPLRKPLADDAYGDVVSYLKLSEEERNKRYTHVKTQMWRYLKMRLYTRNLYDALMIQVARGIYSFKELKTESERLNQIVIGTTILGNEKKKLSIENMTQTIEHDLLRIESKEEFERLVQAYAKFFCLGSRTVGERLKRICEERHKQDKHYNFKQAVAVYVPRCKDTYDKIFECDICVSRDWLLELCYKLRLNLDEINTVLYSAGMYQTTEAELYEKYQLYPYAKVKAYSLQERLAFAVLIAAYLKEHEEMEYMPPIDYMLDYFWDGKGEDILETVQKKLENFKDIYLNEDECEDKLVSQLRDCFISCENIWSIEEYGVKSQLYQDYRNEFSQYYTAPKSKKSQGTDENALNVLYFMAALSYSLFLGKTYTGRICGSDRDELLEVFGGEDSSLKVVYLFLNNFLDTFLGSKVLCMKEDKQFYVIVNGKARKSFSIDSILMDFYESWSMATDEM